MVVIETRVSVHSLGDVCSQASQSDALMFSLMHLKMTQFQWVDSFVYPKLYVERANGGPSVANLIALRDRARSSHFGKVFSIGRGLIQCSGRAGSYKRW